MKAVKQETILIEMSREDAKKVWHFIIRHIDDELADRQEIAEKADQFAAVLTEAIHKPLQ